VATKLKTGVILTLVVMGTVGGSFAYSGGTPEQAVVEILTASKAEEVEKHLPIAVVKEIESLDLAGRRECEQELLIGESLRRQGILLSAPDDGSTLIVLQHGETQTSISLQREVVGGDQAILELLTNYPSSSESAIVLFSMEEGEWRVSEFQHLGYSDKVVLNASFVSRFRDPAKRATESAVTSILYTIHWAANAYYNANPEIGYPSDLSVLTNSTGGDQDNDEVQGGLDASMAHNDFTSAGYVFHYELRQSGGEGQYLLTARPVSFGKTGRTSFLMDASGTIRETLEDREATSSDEAWVQRASR
jgi:hypothetical protein